MTTAAEYINDALFSDLHKEVYGFRPVQDQYNVWLSMSLIELEIEHGFLLEALERSQDDERSREQAAVAKFEARMTELLSSGARDRATAVRWLQQAHGAEDDIGYLEYQLGLPYHYLEGQV